MNKEKIMINLEEIKGALPRLQSSLKEVGESL